MSVLALVPRAETPPPSGTTARTRPLRPFGLEVVFPDGTAFASIDVALLHRWVEDHRLVVLRGVIPMEKAELALAARALGPLHAWPFGAINELKPSPAAKNYLYTDRKVPLHWDGAFVGDVPRYLFFHCVHAPEGVGQEEEGQTVFVDTTRVWKAADEATRDRWRALTMTYETARVVHYGGKFSSRVVGIHPSTGEPVLRFAEPVDDLNPVHVAAVGLSPLESAAVITELRERLSAPDAVQAHRWQTGDLVIADNHALLHGRRAFARVPNGHLRHLRRINVHAPRARTFRTNLRDAIRIRRPEFMVAEIPIALLPLLLLRHMPGASTLDPAIVGETVELFFLLFHFGDMVNCLADRDLDLVYKTRLAEAVRGLGTPNVRLQIAATGALALGLAVDLGIRTDHFDIVGLVAFGLGLAAAYSVAPVRLKGRGGWQTLALWAVIFIGPMLLVTRATFGGFPPLPMFVFAAAYGAMQQGVILVNTAEDFSEDVAAGIRTTAVALGLGGCLRLSAAMVGGGAAVALGALAVIGTRAEVGRGALALATLPLFVVALRVGRKLQQASRAVRTARDEEAALERLRPYARRMPLWITATAWTTLFAAAVIARAGTGP